MEWLMANYFVDSTTGNDGDAGTDMDLAWATLEKAHESGGLAAGDIVWVRRLHSETLSSTIACLYDGTPTAPIRTIGWPRAADSSITSATWTNGSTTVDLIVGLSMDREKHLARYITGPDEKTYFITKIVDSNTILIDKEYAGGTVTGANGACTIQEDPDYDLAQAIDDSGWTIDVAAWTADADDLPNIDGGAGAFYIDINSDQFLTWDNLDITSGTSYCINVVYGRSTSLRGILISTDANAVACYLRFGDFHLERVIITGNGAGGSQNGVVLNDCRVFGTDVAIYNTGDHPLYSAYANLHFHGLNVGVETATPLTEDVNMVYWATLTGRDIKFGASIGLLERGAGGLTQSAHIAIENYNRVLGSHIVIDSNGTVTSVDVVDGSGDPYKRTGGADTVVEVLYDQSSTTQSNPNIHKRFNVRPVLTHEFEATTDRRKYRYYVQAEGAVLASELWMEVEYVSGYGDATTEYTIKKLTSDEAITVRGDASDWSQYIEVDNVTPAVASKKIYIDPLPEVTT
jgi:hypothetical protein